MQKAKEKECNFFFLKKVPCAYMSTPYIIRSLIWKLHILLTQEPLRYRMSLAHTHCTSFQHIAEMRLTGPYYRTTICLKHCIVVSPRDSTNFCAVAAQPVVIVVVHNARPTDYTNVRRSARSDL
jgi:hypothetical protein